jgi:hypothetical protein
MYVIVGIFTNGERALFTDLCSLALTNTYFHYYYGQNAGNINNSRVLACTRGSTIKKQAPKALTKQLEDMRLANKKKIWILVC